ncbi:MAG: DNA (cytosine-5-)-methyltransferase [Campylobacteraceae bacterium]|nr:DNA (cytosine-5-)-methyltransferase [Campylobacteraceae bacterium]MDY4121491.1 DNA (cytosine-5-)-methyltransferase [Campylobacter sp.]
MKFLELCAGIGGFRQALENLGCECVGYSEIDKYAIKLYSAFFNDERNFGDVTKIEAEKLPDFELLVGGFPCQAFSIAGKRGGFDDTRGTIFFDFARIMKAKKPKFAIFENVKGLLNHDGGKTYETMLRTLNEIGYDAQWGILNTRFHGLPQNRERVYIVANLRERSSTKILFERGDDITDKVERTELGFIGNYHTKSGIAHQRSGVLSEDSVAPCLNASDYKEPRIVKIGSIGGKPCQSDQVYSPSGVSVTLSAQNGGKGAMTGLYKIGDIDGLNTQYSRVYDSEGVSTTINAQGGGLGAKTGLYSAGDKVRRLTPKECFRLQGFKDEMVELGYKLGISDTQLYKMAGNAVSVPVVEWVAQRVLNWDNLRNADSDYLF